MTNKNQTAAQKAAAQKKADEVAALMEEDSEKKPVTQIAPPEIKESTAIKDHESDEADDQKDNEGDDLKSGVINDQNDDEIDDQDGDEIEFSDDEKDAHFVILSKTIHTKDKAGNDVKFIASKEPQDLGEYSEIAIKAGLAKSVIS